jgi:hypothetical protein
MRILRAIVISFLLLINISNDVSCADNQTTSIKEALKRLLCYEGYWHRAPEIISGATLPLEIKIEGDNFFIWINKLKYKGKYMQNMEGYYWGQMKNGMAGISRSELHPIDLMPSIQQDKYRHQFETGIVIKDTLIMPKDCTPIYEPTTPKKELMLQTVVSTMQKQLSDFLRMGIAKYPKEVTIIIADFNIDYPYTFVWVEYTKNLFIVTLHDPNDYFSDKDERDGEYPFGEEYNKPKSLLEKVRKHGIIRKIVLDP